MNTAEQKIPQAKSLWGTPDKPTYKSTKLPYAYDRIEWKDFHKRLGNAAWVWLAIVVSAPDINAFTRAGFTKRIEALGGPALSIRQIEKQLAKLYKLEIVTHIAAGENSFRRKRRATGKFPPGEVQERSALGGAILADGRPETACLPKLKVCRELMTKAISQGGTRRGAGRPKKRKKSDQILVSSTPENVAARFGATAGELETLLEIVRQVSAEYVISPQQAVSDLILLLQTTKHEGIENPPGARTCSTRTCSHSKVFGLKKAAITGNQKVSDGNIKCQIPPAGASQTPIFQGSVIGTDLALKILTDLSSYDLQERSTDSCCLKRESVLFPFSDENGKKNSPQSRRIFNLILSSECSVGRFILPKTDSDQIQLDPLQPSPANSPAEREPCAPAAPVKIQQDYKPVLASPLPRLKGPREECYLQPGDEGWRPTLRHWPVVPMPRGWDKFSSVDKLALQAMVRLYTEYRDVKFNRRWWFHGQAQAQPWWKRGLETVQALRAADIPPGVWIAWVASALWQSDGPVPHSMVFSPTLVNKHKAWCLSTQDAHVVCPTRFPPSLMLLHQEWKQAQKARTSDNPLVVARFRQLQEQAEVEAKAMQADLHAQVRDGRWVW